MFLNVGAYGLTASPGGFISQGSPSEIMFNGKDFVEIREREGFDFLIGTQKKYLNKGD